MVAGEPGPITGPLGPTGCATLPPVGCVPVVSMLPPVGFTLPGVGGLLVWGGGIEPPAGCVPVDRQIGRAHV